MTWKFRLEFCNEKEKEFTIIIIFHIVSVLGQEEVVKYGLSLRKILKAHLEGTYKILSYIQRITFEK